MFPTKFQVHWPFGSGGEAKLVFQDVGHLAFPIGTTFAIFELLVTLMLPNIFHVN